MSMTSRSYRPFKCCSQTRLIFSIASTDFDVDPLMYKRKTYFAWREWDAACSIFPADPGSPAHSDVLGWGPGFRFPAGLLFFGGFFMWAFLSRVSLPLADPGL